MTYSSRLRRTAIYIGFGTYTIGFFASRSIVGMVIGIALAVIGCQYGGRLDDDLQEITPQESNVS